jgi:hypothetical protein
MFSQACQDIESDSILPRIENKQFHQYGVQWIIYQETRNRAILDQPTYPGPRDIVPVL